MAPDLDSLARRLAVPHYDDALPAHDAFHAERVRDLSLRLAADWDRSVDRGVLAAAAWLHDIGRPLERTGEIDDHGEWAAVEASDLLASEGVAADRVDAVVHCLRSHSIRSNSPDPETPAAKLLFDADKLDAAGAVGVVRLACIVGERSGRAGEKYAAIDSGPVPGTTDAGGTDDARTPDLTLLREWARERLDALYTPPGRRRGESRWAFMQDFFDRFEAETAAPDS
ncbi:HD domain-containing protein [Halosimplex pelagicum]|uniref:HD domain-containing protein n=1 Tax=Halosimplex pelagicum TaxID=869886 RepID=A0A7D5TQT1_9EURY|nr:HD domain-containing protein [Halosimplex pelagicum]QLH80652.1 HD domain-containing protein [Halosimplex pelagicum]